MKNRLLFLFGLPLFAMAQTNTFPNSGNVDVGTTSPLEKIHLQYGKLLIKSGASTNNAAHASGLKFVIDVDSRFAEIPDAKLTVKGKVHAEEVKVDLSVPGPDYVFNEDYELRSLEEIREYIEENGHLPNIPSAAEMEENGVQLGLMNMKLLEKIEELVLYTLHQEEKVKALQQENKTLFQLQKQLELRMNQLNNNLKSHNR